MKKSWEFFIVICLFHAFPFFTKADLGREVEIQYRREFMAILRAIESGKSSCLKKLEAYTQLFWHMLEKDHKVCLCIMQAAEH